MNTLSYCMGCWQTKPLQIRIAKETSNTLFGQTIYFWNFLKTNNSDKSGEQFFMLVSHLLYGKLEKGSSYSMKYSSLLWRKFMVHLAFHVLRCSWHCPNYCMMKIFPYIHFSGESVCQQEKEWYKIFRKISNAFEKLLISYF